MTHPNPLLNFDALTDFAALKPEHITPAIDALLAEGNRALERAVSDAVPADYQALSLALDVPVEKLKRAWGVVGHLQSVADAAEQRAAYTENLPRVTEFFTRLGADERLYAKVKAMAASSAAQRLHPDQRTAIEHAVRDFVLGGAELQGAARERFAAIQERAAALSQAFGEHALDATDAYSYLASEAEVRGLPDDVKASARAAAEADGHPDHYKLTLHDPCIRPVLRFADDRALRERLYTAHARRAGEAGPAELDNGPVMRELVALRQEEAALLGHPTFADLALVPKMARSPREVLAFLRDLARRARPFAERDVAELREFAARELGLHDLQAWDLPYASEKLSQARYAFSSAEVKRYFQAPQVLAGLFRLIETLFDVAIRPADAPVWHPDASFHSVERGGVRIGGFYLDLYARTGKQSGAWMNDAQQRWKRPDTAGLQLPIAYLVCNFTPPTGRAPSLLTHDDLITLFHEFGHGLHHLLTQVEDAAVSGIAGVEWDAVELPSQFMENFCWEWAVLQRLSAHVDTGAPLPRELFDRMLAARNFQSGLQMLRSCEYGLFDMRLHYEPGACERIEALLGEVRDEVALLRPPAFQRVANTFTHLFDGPYAAGYYGYAWAEVLSADAYSAFEEAGVFDPETGRRYREQILERGGGRSALENFKAFRGREPRLDALLRHQGMA